MVLTAQKDPADSRPTAAMQGSLFGAGQVQCGSITARPTVLDPGSTVTFQPGWLQGSQTLFDQLTKDMPWKAMQRPMYDRMVNVPRLICTLSTSELTTADPLLLITGELERHVGGAFSSIGLNLYRDGWPLRRANHRRAGGARKPPNAGHAPLSQPGIKPSKTRRNNRIHTSNTRTVVPRPRRSTHHGRSVPTSLGALCPERTVGRPANQLGVPPVGNDPRVHVLGVWGCHHCWLVAN